MVQYSQVSQPTFGSNIYVNQVQYRYNMDTNMDTIRYKIVKYEKAAVSGSKETYSETEKYILMWISLFQELVFLRFCNMYFSDSVICISLIQ